MNQRTQRINSLSNPTSAKVLLPSAVGDILWDDWDDWDALGSGPGES